LLKRFLLISLLSHFQVERSCCAPVTLTLSGALSNH
jgi:hypothetical protein